MVKAIGETAASPLVVATRDLLAVIKPLFRFRPLEPRAELERKIAKKNPGWGEARVRRAAAGEEKRYPDGKVPMWTVVQDAYTIASEVLQRIWFEEHDSVTLPLVDRITAKTDTFFVLSGGEHLPVYRNPGYAEAEYLRLMLEAGCDEDHALSIPAMPGKRCGGCGVTRRRLHFYRNVTHADLKSSRCKACDGSATARREFSFRYEPEETILLWARA